jgi:aldose 1-epimerase
MSSVHRKEVAIYEGEVVAEYTLSNADVEVTVLSFGGTLISMKHKGEELVLARKTVGEILECPHYCGGTIGRCGNRIANGSFVVDGKSYSLNQNNGTSSLHGGKVGFDKRNWDSSGVVDDEGASVRLHRISADGEEGYPGELDVYLTYTLTRNNELTLTYAATTTKPTPINLTNHGYWNLSGDFKRKVTTSNLLLRCSQVLESDATSLVTGTILPVDGTPFDMTQELSPGIGPLLDKSMAIGADTKHPGFDHTFVLDGAMETEDQSFAPVPGYGLAKVANSSTSDRIDIEKVLPTLPPLEPKQIAVFTDKESGRQLEVSTTTPGMQVYTGTFLSLIESKFPFTKHNAMCMETQHFPNSINEPSFPSNVLRPGVVYRQKTIYALKQIE